MGGGIKVSVIVPVYGVEKFVGRCIESLMRQTLDEIEYIIIDDCTPDSSIEIIKAVVERYPHRESYIRYIEHSRNRGLPAARNTGLQSAIGEYIFHCDSDDFLERDMLERLYRAAVRKDCDYVWCDWYLTFDSKSRVMKQPSAKSAREALTLMLAGAMRYNVWNKLVKRDLYARTGIRFPEGSSMGEDMTMIRLAAKASSVGYVDKPLYHYIRTNSEAMTQAYSDTRLRELRSNVDATCNFLRECDIEGIEQELNWFKLNVKLPFLFNGNKADIVRWKQWYPEANRDIMSNHMQSIRTRLLQWAAAHHLSFVNLLYYRLVYSLYYSRFK
jgi:hypothetical protein BACCOPRO_03219